MNSDWYKEYCKKNDSAFESINSKLYRIYGDVYATIVDGLVVSVSATLNEACERADILKNNSFPTFIYKICPSLSEYPTWAEMRMSL